MQDKKHMYLTVSKADFFQLQFFQATARLEEKQFFQVYFFPADCELF